MDSLIDASSALHAWENYPIELFPELWQWLAERIENKEIQCIQIIIEEIKRKLPKCSDWLFKLNKKIHIIPIDDSITQKAVAIMKRLGLDGNKYHPNGVGENDIFLIATAMLTNMEVITNEAKQAAEPKNRQKYKIPLVCQTQQPPVPCHSFIDYVKNYWRPI